MSAKLFKCTPQQLPGDLKANLLAMLQCGVNALEGYIRPGLPASHAERHGWVSPPIKQLVATCINPPSGFSSWEQLCAWQPV